MTLFRNRYRVETTRLRTWNYANEGWYFVTICTQRRSHYFGTIINTEMHLSPMGEVAATEWLKTPEIRPYVGLDEWVIMPNHQHGIVVIDWSNVETPRGVTAETPRGAPLQASFQPPGSKAPVTTNQFGPLQPSSLQSILNGYKGAVTRGCRKVGYQHFGWQERFYEHIIRSEEELQRIRTYIVNNPAQWAFDQENPAGLWM